MSKSSTNRHVGIELLRIISMFMVVSLHFFIHGKFDSSSDMYVNNESWIMASFSTVSVNCYVLISGYFLCTSKFKLSRVVNVFASEWFYSIVSFVLLVALKLIDFSFGGLMGASLPLTTDYWFVCAYIELLVFSPLLNYAIMHMSRRQFKLVIIMLIGVYCVFNNIVKFINPIEQTSGFGVVWFICLYLSAAYIRLYYKSIQKYYRYLLLYLLTVIINYILHFFTFKFGQTYQIAMFRDYNDVLVYLGALFLFIFFLNIKIDNKIISKIVCFIAPLTFGVYLIHENKYVRDLLWGYINVDTLNISGPIFIFIGIGLILAIFIVCVLLEFVRKLIFKITKIDTILFLLSNKIELYIKKFVK